jgi:hypothetical protein
MDMKRLAKVIGDKLGDGYEVKVEKRSVENDVIQEVLVIIDPERVGTVFYMKDALPENIEDAAAVMIDQYRSLKKPECVENVLNMTGDNLKDEVVVCVCDLDHNKGYLDGVPYKSIANLALYMRCLFGAEGMSVKITQALIDNMRLDFDDLYEHAVKNTKKHTRTMAMADMLGVEDFDCPMWVVTNDSGVYGAGSIVNTEAIRSICRRTDSDKMMIIPSSIHELILLPMDFGCDTEYAKDIVKATNATVLKNKDKLADSLYVYDMAEDVIATV